MATQVFSEAELARLRGFPDIDREQLVRFFTLTPADEAFVRSHRGSSNRIGVAVQLCTLPWLGFVPDDVASAPAAAVQRLAGHLDIGPKALVSYGDRDQTRTDHLVEVTKLLGWRGGRRRGVQGAGPVPGRPGVGARLADAAVPPGV